jgi:SAM-dependent methyltransferase
MGTLPITVAPDGTPVAPYLVLPAQAEADLIHRALPPGAEVLELGCGAGRVSRRLADLGHHVSAVDHSHEMIQHVERHASLTVLRADIETLSLSRTFGGVVLASYLVNVTDRAKRSRFLAACRRHVMNEGAVVIQRLDPETYWTPGAESLFGPVHVQLVEAAVRDQILSARLEYRIDDQVFPQTVVAEILDDAAVLDELGNADLRLDHWIDAQKTWLVARPVARSCAW